jgi:hypothetical protein
MEQMATQLAAANERRRRFASLLLDPDGCVRRLGPRVHAGDQLGQEASVVLVRPLGLVGR